MEKITEKIAGLPSDATFFSVEFFPPKTQAGFNNLLPRLQRLHALGPLFTTVTWGAGGSTATKSLELASITQSRLGLTTCLHLTCTNMQRSVLDNALERCRELGVRNLLALRGDEPIDELHKQPNGIQSEENGTQSAEDVNGEHDEPKFDHAVDLVRYIRRKHGTYFCIGVAAYPEGHSTSAYDPSQSAESDVPFLIEKVNAGADFLMTQLFYDVDAFLRFERMLRDHKSGVFNDILIIPGLMPVQSWSILTRTTKLACASVPPAMMARFETGKGDDEKVKQMGVTELSSIVEQIKSTLQVSPLEDRQRRPQGFHFYTLNLEKAVAQILERCKLIKKPASDENANNETAIGSDDEDFAVGSAKINGHTPTSAPLSRLTKDRRRLSSANSGPHNRVVVANSRRTSQASTPYEAPEDEAGVPREKDQSRANALAISEGEGSLGREATWDDYPNGRWGDARSPAYGSIDGYGPSLHISAPTALSLWSYPTQRSEITQMFHDYLTGTLSAIPWSEESLSPETALIRQQLLALTQKGYWTVASQPAVNAARSDDPVVGWGPKAGGHVWQKPFVEFFVTAEIWKGLRATLVDAGSDKVAFFAGNTAGEFDASGEGESVCPVTWGAFKGKEIITPTLITSLSFTAWRDEAFALWYQWQRLYAPHSASAKLLQGLREDVWLVNVIGHDYLDEGRAFWQILGVDVDA